MIKPRFNHCLIKTIIDSSILRSAKTSEITLNLKRSSLNGIMFPSSLSSNSSCSAGSASGSSGGDTVFENKIAALKRLFTKRCINVPEDWIRNAERQTEVDGIKPYDRWLASDVRNINGVQPGALANIRFSTDVNKVFQDSFALQVIDCWNSSEPRNKLAASDLLEGMEQNESSDSDAENDQAGKGRGRGGGKGAKTTKGGKGRGKTAKQNDFLKTGPAPAMFAMILTDGAAEVKVAEFEPIPEWREAMPITQNSKVLLKGPIRADTNVIFLKPENFQLLYKAPPSNVQSNQHKRND